MKKHFANMLTGFRIACSIFLLLVPVFSLQFYIAYLLCGFSDMLDGPIARKTNGVSVFGERFDTAADVIFLIVSFIKLLPVLKLPKWIWIWIGVIAVIRFGNVILGFVLSKKLICSHTVMLKITGAVLFLLPLTLQIVEVAYSAVAVCSVATIAAIHEMCLVGREKWIA